MAPYREDQLRKIADAPTIRAIDIWRSLSSEVLGQELEVVVDNRRNHSQFASFDGELNVAMPAGYKGKVVLSVWLDSFPNYHPLLLTHEIGHWILHFRGFRGFIRQPRNGALEGLFNDVASHPPLYALQRSIGHDPQTEIDSRCDHNIRLCSQSRKGDPIICGLMFADDLLNCSWKKRGQLKWAVQKQQPETAKILDKIMKTASRYDLSKPDTNIGFRRELLKRLEIQGKWLEKDDVEETKKLIVQINGTAKVDLTEPSRVPKSNTKPAKSGVP